MILFLWGEDSYRSHQKLKKIKEKFQQERDPSGLNIVVLEGDKFDLEKFNNAAVQQGFIVSKRLIIIKNLLMNKPNKELVDSLIEILDRIKDGDNVFIFYEQGAPDKRNKLYKYLSKDKKLSEEFSTLTPFELESWVKEYIKINNGKVEKKAINLLISFVGNNLWQLSNELDKLISFKNKGVILEKDIENMVQAKLDENIFGLVDAISNNNKSLALKLLTEQFEVGLNEIYIFSMITRQFRILSILASLKSQKLSEVEIVKLTKLHPYVVKKLLPVSSKFKFQRLQDIYNKLTEIDLKLKSTSLPPQTLIDLFIQEI
ncbi:DNA polymerase III subunit delta [bacterium]|jgi:DNA polymerase III subunit delta|nr:DNA polymerase III subunit delta [bacterium]MBT4121330.1 DNA polymerase III subunit delta [bacterium]MBT4335712.1 DNA polymerase III subunit delta [bacterium]MBT4495721.1 DNA polymerase III subunit delta [bacterium]MBT4763597.1 DNA polymerase III subunit delta [bacterium]